MLTIIYLNNSINLKWRHFRTHFGQFIQKMNQNWWKKCQICSILTEMSLKMSKWFMNNSINLKLRHFRTHFGQFIQKMNQNWWKKCQICSILTKMSLKMSKLLMTNSINLKWRHFEPIYSKNETKLVENMSNLLLFDRNEFENVKIIDDKFNQLEMKTFRTNLFKKWN